jgi:hypothetical protein
MVDDQACMSQAAERTLQMMQVVKHTSKLVLGHAAQGPRTAHGPMPGTGGSMCAFDFQVIAQPRMPAAGARRVKRKRTMDRRPMMALVMTELDVKAPWEMMDSSTLQFWILAGGRKRGEVTMGPSGSKNSNLGGSCASARLASKNDLMVPMSSQYPLKRYALTLRPAHRQQSSSQHSSTQYSSSQYSSSQPSRDAPGCCSEQSCSTPYMWLGQRT